MKYSALITISNILIFAGLGMYVLSWQGASWVLYTGIGVAVLTAVLRWFKKI